MRPSIAQFKRYARIKLNLLEHPEESLRTGSLFHFSLCREVTDTSACVQEMFYVWYHFRLNAN